MNPPVLNEPDAAGWTIAAGLAMSLHIGLAAILVMALSNAPGAAPGPMTEIVLRSAPLISGGETETASRLAATRPEERLPAQEEQTQATLVENAEDLAALRPDLSLSALAEPQATSATDATTQRLSGIGAERPGQPAQPQAAESARPVAPQAERTVTRILPLAEAPANRSLQAQTRPVRPEAPSRLNALETVTPQVATPAPVSPDRAAPQRLVAEGHALATTPTAAAPAQTARLRAEASRAPAAQASEPPAQASPRTTPEALRMAMQPPLEDTLERALRDRPRTFLSDRRAAPRPEARMGIEQDDPAQDQPLLAAVRDHLRSLPDIPCFAALPALGVEGRLQLEVFGPAMAGLEAFQDRLEAETGPIPAMGLQPVTQGQCETLDFVRRSREYPAFGLFMTLAERRIASGSPLQGHIHQVTGRDIALLLVDNAGRIHSLAQFLRSEGSESLFTVPLALRGPSVETWQLLLAVATGQPLQTIANLSGPQEAAPFFARMRAEIATRGLVPDMALVAFSLN